MERLRQMPDPRIERTRRHALMGILLIAPCTVIGGADNWVDVVQFGKAKKEWFATFLKLPNGMASHGMVLGQAQTDKKSNEITASAEQARPARTAAPSEMRQPQQPLTP